MRKGASQTRRRVRDSQHAQRALVREPQWAGRHRHGASRVRLNAVETLSIKPQTCYKRQRRTLLVVLSPPTLRLATLATALESRSGQTSCRTVLLPLHDLHVTWCTFMTRSSCLAPSNSVERCYRKCLILWSCEISTRPTITVGSERPASIAAAFSFATSASSVP